VLEPLADLTVPDCVTIVMALLPRLQRIWEEEEAINPEEAIPMLAGVMVQQNIVRLVGTVT
jgi:hypothetical protein